MATQQPRKLQVLGNLGGSGSGLTEEQAADLTANTEARHTHNNKNALDGFATDPTAKTRVTHNGHVLAYKTEIPSDMSAVEVQNAWYHNQQPSYGTKYMGITALLAQNDIIKQQLSTIPKFAIEVVDSLPTENISSTTVYLLKDTESDGNLYTEHIYINDTWEMLGTQSVDVDLTDYRKVDELVPAEEVGYTHQNLVDASGTVKGALDEAIDFVTESLPELEESKHTHSNKDTLDNIDSLFVRKTDVTTEIETALAKAKESGEFDGADGQDGTNGKDGSNGADGYTPVKGTDYFTEADKAEIVDDVVTETGIEIIPDYVIAEAESVINRIIAAQGNRTFTFAAISDLHYGNGNYTDGVKHACQAMKYIDKRIKLDAVAVLGDYTDGYPVEDFENAIGDFKTINSVLADLRFAPNLRTQGNHDYYADHTALVNRFIQSYSDNVVWGDKLGGYFYRDFEDFKLRVICVNTTETGNSNIGCSTAQFEWFISSLDLTAKEDVAEWQILVLSHHPLDWYCIDSTYRFAYYLNGYKNGASGKAGGIAYDFTGKNSATLIGNIHGHIHNLLTDYINIGNINTSNPTAVMRMCTPEACINRANQYDGWKEDTAYNKTINTAQDTSFVVYCVDLDTYTINAICYGAGYDRSVKYGTGEIITTYKVTNNLTNVSNSNSAVTAKTGDSYTATLTVTAGEIKSVVVTMGGVDITSTAYSNGVISIASVTGNIVITAVAEVPETTYTNLLKQAIDSNGSAYNGGQGWKTGTRLGSAGTESAQSGMEVTGFIPVTKADTIYFSGITWALGSALASKCYFHLYDSSFAKVTGQQLTTDLSTGGFTYDEAGNPIEIKTQAFLNWASAAEKSDSVAYFRISAEEITTDSVITVNEPIE